MARKVYKRAGIIHICFKGALYALGSRTSQITVKDKVDVIAHPGNVNHVTVSVPDTSICETWSMTEIGSPRKASRSAPRHNGGSTKAQTEKPTEAHRKLTGEDGRPTADDVDVMLTRTSPNDIALSVMRACWANWYDSDRHLDLMQELRWFDKNDTSCVKDLGAQLMEMFR